MKILTCIETPKNNQYHFTFRDEFNQSSVGYFRTIEEAVIYAKNNPIDIDAGVFKFYPEYESLIYENGFLKKI
jgi:hypothetical protein